jgi:purine-binding chemotaxis protein CheW
LLEGGYFMPTIDKSTEMKNLKDEKFILFSLENRNYGLDVKYVNHIISCIDIEKNNDLPNYFEGTVDYLGKKLPVLDLRKKYGKIKSKLSKKPYIIVSAVNNKNVGLIVDSISEVIYLNKKDIKPAVKVKSIFNNNSIKGISNKNNIVSILVDMEKILNEKDYKVIEKYN